MVTKGKPTDPAQKKKKRSHITTQRIPTKQTITKRRPRRETCIYYTGKGAVRQQFLPVLRQTQRHSGKETRVRGLFCAKCDQFTESQQGFPQRCGKSC